MKKSLLALAALAFALPAAAEPYVWLDTERGPIVIELDPQHSPNTVEHFLSIVNDGFYDNMLFTRTIEDFVIQTGRIDVNAVVHTWPTTVDSERDNGLSNTRGTVSLALPSNNPDGGSAEFFISLGNNSHLDSQFTVFGHVTYGMSVADAIGDQVTYSNDVPYRPTLIKRAVETDGFPIMPLHAGSWYDPAKSGRGIALDIGTVSGGDDTPVAVVYWYDYVDGEQVWLQGAKPFAWGDSSVTVPLQRTSGGQFGDAFDPSQVSSDTDFGTLTIQFSGCEQGTFDYQTKLGNGSMTLQRITIPDGKTCLDE